VKRCRSKKTAKFKRENQLTKFKLNLRWNSAYTIKSKGYRRRTNFAT